MPGTPQATVIATDAGPGTEPFQWEDIRGRFTEERWYWLATTGPGGRPQARPMLAVWLRDKVYSTTNPGAAKARNLGRHPECSLAGRATGLDIVVEGPVSWVSGRATAEDVAAAYRDKYEWPVTVTDENMFDAPYGAPTAGTPPYRVYEVTPRLVYAFGTGDDFPGVRSTRFRLGPR